MNKKDLFQFKDRTVIYVGKEPLFITIPTRYESYNAFYLGTFLKTVGIFECRVGNEVFGFCLPAILEMHPSDTVARTYDGDTFLEAVFENGDVFIASTLLVQDASLLYLVFTEFLAKKGVPSFIDYHESPFIFDRTAEVTGAAAHLQHIGYQFAMAHLMRDPDNISVPYRYTNRKKDPKQVTIIDIPNAATSVPSRITAAYLGDSLNTMLNTEHTTVSKVEQILRS